MKPNLVLQELSYQIFMELTRSQYHDEKDQQGKNKQSRSFADRNCCLFRICANLTIFQIIRLQNVFLPQEAEETTFHLLL